MPDLHPLAAPHLPPFITAPNQTDVLFVAVVILLLAAVLAAGVFFFWLHSLPERMVHNKVQFDLVCVLALLSLFTHIHAFWVAALIIAFIEFPSFSFPDFSNSLRRIAGSLETVAGSQAHSAPAPAPQSTGEKSVLPAQTKSADPTAVKHTQEPARKRGAEHA